MPGTTSVVDAAKVMATQRIGALLVVDGGRLVGIFTERDALSRVLAKGADPKATTLAEVMTPGPLTVSAEKPLAHALIIMHENGFRHMPVVDGGKLAGVVSVRDALGSEMSELTGNLDALERIAENMR
jgi:CBS domain-containing protein